MEREGDEKGDNENESEEGEVKYELSSGYGKALFWSGSFNG
jgi:hypothetical protein